LLLLKKHARIDLKPENSPLLLNLSREFEEDESNSGVSSLGFLKKKMGFTGYNNNLFPRNQYYQGFN